MSDRLAMVAGATGVAGQSLVTALVESGWQVIAVSRHIQADPRPEVTTLPVDLGDPQLLADSLSPHRVTHLFYAVQYRERIARSNKVTDLKKLRRQLRMASIFMPLIGLIPGAKAALYRRVAKESGAADPQGMNLRFFQNLIQVLEQQSHDLRHVALLTGGKHYGMHLGPSLYPAHQSPYTEDLTPRAPGPNWYYDIEDFIESHAPRWTWSLFRPSFIVGSARNAPYNLGTTLAVYAVLRKARGEPLIFFGDKEIQRTRFDITSAAQLAEMMIWSGETPTAHDQAFNCTTGEPFLWEQIWPEIAQWFGLEAEFTADGIPVRTFFEENEELWKELVETHGLQDFSLSSLSSDDFVDRAMCMNWEACFNMEKIQAAGFTLSVQPAQVFTELFECMMNERIIPSPEQVLREQKS